VEITMIKIMILTTIALIVDSELDLLAPLLVCHSQEMVILLRMVEDRRWHLLGEALL
jgi:hypothetical protein